MPSEESVVARMLRVCRGHAMRRCVIILLCASGIYLLFSTALDSLTTHRKVYSQEHGPLSTTKQELHVVAKHPVVIASIYASSEDEGVESDHHGDVRGTPHSVSPHVLLLYGDKASVDVVKRISALLQSHRVPHDAHSHSDSTFDLLTSEPVKRDGQVVGKYCLIVCAGLFSNLQRFRDYSEKFNVTVVSFASMPVGVDKLGVGVVTVVGVSPNNITGVRLNPSKDFYYLKNEEWITDFHDNISRWSTFLLADSTDIETLASIKYHSRGVSGNKTTPLVLVMGGGGRGQGAEVLIGSPVGFWLSKVLLLEVIRSHSSVEVLRFGRTRWVMIDIDDIFVAPDGLKMSTDDVQVNDL